MSARRLVALLMAVMLAAPTLAGAQDVPPPPPGAPPSPPPDLPSGAVAPAQVDPAVTPARLSYLSGAVSFRRPGADDWAAAAVNTPLAPGDTLYVGQAGALEIQLGPQALIRAAQETQLGLDNQEADFVQVSVPLGHVAVDVAQLPSGSTIEIDTPNGAFTLEQPGYYRVDVTGEWAALAVHRGGRASVTTASGGETPIEAGQQAVVSGTDAPRVDLRANPPLDAWDQWNQTRTAQLQQGESARYVASGVYGTEALDRHGSWHVEESYGRVWVPASVPAGWVPYSTGRWIWDPRFGWTWLDEAPWGWAPYHYGRWVFVRSRWAWAPGPVVVRPVYAPALVVFLGGRTVGRPLCWAPLAWGEPVIPWWGRPGFVGVATWAGWGGPRVVNNVVVNRTTVRVTNITVYRHVRVTKAVVGVPAERFGRDHVRPVRISATEAQQLRPVRGAPRVQPVAASVAPTRGRGIAPPAAAHRREVVATRKPHDPSPSLRAVGLPATGTQAPARNTRVVSPPGRRTPPAREGTLDAGRPRDERTPDVNREPRRQPDASGDQRARPDVDREQRSRPDASRDQRERPADAGREPRGRQPDASRDQRARPADVNPEPQRRRPDASRDQRERPEDVNREPGRRPDASRERPERPPDAARGGDRGDIRRPDVERRDGDAPRRDGGAQSGDGNVQRREGDAHHNDGSAARRDQDRPRDGDTRGTRSSSTPGASREPLDRQREQAPRPPAPRSQQPPARLQPPESPDAGRAPRPAPRPGPSSEAPARTDRATRPEAPSVGPGRPALAPPAVAPGPVVKPQPPAAAPRVVDRPVPAPPAPPRSVERPAVAPPPSPVAPRAIERAAPPES
ncbi:MAG: DUF6600 domain-containing protein, partial [Candidatus Rokuibacteriota bacterium]